MIELNPVLIPKSISAQYGKLVYDETTDTIEYIKFKEQASGRVNIFVWIIIQLTRAMRDHSLLFKFSRADVTKIEYKDPSAFKYGEINITAQGKTYKIKFKKDTLDPNVLGSFLDLFKDKLSKIVQ